MRPLRYSINVTLDGCCDHRVNPPTDEELMEAAWRQPATGTWPDWMADWMMPFARTIDRAKKYVVSRTLDRVDWNAELVQGDLEKAVQQLKREPGCHKTPDWNRKKPSLWNRTFLQSDL